MPGVSHRSSKAARTPLSVRKELFRELADAHSAQGRCVEAGLMVAAVVQRLVF
jgi:hypothetical protein